MIVGSLRKTGASHDQRITNRMGAGAQTKGCPCGMGGGEMNDREIIEKCNDLAREFYKMMGYVRTKSFSFYQATHTQERLCWEMARLACETLSGDEIEDALEGLDAK